MSGKFSNMFAVAAVQGHTVLGAKCQHTHTIQLALDTFDTLHLVGVVV
jgi:hypothetical protein